MTPAFDTVFSEDEIPAYPLAIIALPGAEEFAEKSINTLLTGMAENARRKPPHLLSFPPTSRVLRRATARQ